MTTKWPQVVLPVRNSTSAGETNDNDVHNCEPNNITVQSKNFPKKIPVYTFRTLKIFVTPFLFALRHTFIGSASLLFLCPPPLPGRGENSTQDCHPCSFCSHKQRCATVIRALVPKIRTGGSFYLGAIFFWWNFKSISLLNLEQIVVTDFCSNDFSEVSLAYLSYQWKPIPENFSQNYQQFFFY